MNTGYDTQRVTTADNVGISFRVAGVATRLTAALLDLLVLGCLLLIVSVLVIAIATAAAGNSSEASTLVVLSLLSYLLFASWVIIAVLYFTISEAVSGGKTLGKSAMGIRVIRVDGGTASIGEYFLRSAAYIVDIFGVGAILLFFHPQSRRLGDLVAGTVVVRERSPLTLITATAPAPVYLRTRDAGPGIDGLSHLGEHELSAVRTFLSRPGLRPEQRADLAGRLTARLLDRMELPLGAPERRWPPELFLERLFMQLAPRFESGGSPPSAAPGPYAGPGAPPPRTP
ncbi:MAG: RDD family protein [Candidatus Dormibacteria bacterium]